VNAFKQLDLFRQRLPDKPYCSDDLTYGLRFEAAERAIKRRYIQPNWPWLKTWLVYDIDKAGAGEPFYWSDRNAPEPNITAVNPENQHAHVFYGLDIPIAIKADGTRAAKYAAAIDYALMRLLEADPGYTCFTAKNPLHQHWIVKTWQEYLYTLGWLADYLDLGKVDARQRSENYGIGRNVNLFNDLRRYAYRAVKNYWHDRRRGYRAFYDDLEIRAAFQNNNLFGADNCLMFPEVGHIIKSVSAWTWKHFTPEDFAEIQRARSLKAAEKRKAEAAERRQQLFAFMAENPNATQAEAAAIHGINQSTISRHLKNYASPISRERGLLCSSRPVPAQCRAALTLEGRQV